MYSDAKRIHLLERLLKEQDDQILNQVDQMLSAKPERGQAAGTAALASVFGILSKEEGAEFDRIIEEGCEQINPDDLKNPFDD